MVAMFADLNPPYSTVVADPPWADRRNGNIAPTRVGREQRDRSIRAQYGTMTPAEVAALPVADLVAADAHLYLWSTNLDLPDTFAIVEAWGFRYNTLITWAKTGHLGMGYHWRGMTEHMLFGVRGKLRTKDRRLRNYFTAAKAGHSVKPAAAYDLIERASPGPYVELFARDPRLGWDSWGKGYEGAA
jgi:N6-adenosine-specific RNA methylase IME4